MTGDESVNATFNRISPTNDDFAAAQLISGASASVSGTNVSATREYSDPWVGTTNAERSVWYRWTAPFSGSATVDTCTSNYDTLLSAFAGRFGLIALNNNYADCPSGTFGSKLTLDVQEDQIYHIGVDGCCGAPAGTYTLALNLVDNVVPETTIHAGPDNGSADNDPSPTFTFDSSETESDFECRLYPSDLTQPASRECSDGSMHTLQSDLDAGAYTFQVRATDPRGNTDQTPATRTWTVDTSNPTVQTWKPTGRKVPPTAKPTVTFSEKMDESLLEASANGKPTTFVLKKGARTAAASVDYFETTGGALTATLDPNKKLQRGATYTASVKTAAEDEAGNAVVARTWKFRVRP